jgi:hypothetical protein
MLLDRKMIQRRDKLQISRIDIESWRQSSIDGRTSKSSLKEGNN